MCSNISESDFFILCNKTCQHLEELHNLVNQDTPHPVWDVTDSSVDKGALKMEGR